MAFLNLRDENDRPNEIKLSKLKTCPFFNKSDIARFPKESERIVNQQQVRYDQETFSDRNQHNDFKEVDLSLKHNNSVGSNNGTFMRFTYSLSQVGKSVSGL